MVQSEWNADQTQFYQTLAFTGPIAGSVCLENKLTVLYIL